MKQKTNGSEKIVIQQTDLVLGRHLNRSVRALERGNGLAAPIMQSRLLVGPQQIVTTDVNYIERNCDLFKLTLSPKRFYT